MRNFIAFIKRFQVLMFFALLQGVSISIYFTYSQYARSKYLTTASYVNGSILEARFSLTKHFNLSQNNIVLQKENAELLRNQPSSLISLDRSYVTVNDSLHLQQYEYIPGIVIQSTHTKTNNYFTINIGHAQGVERGMGVISPSGIIGKIHGTSEHYSIVKSCLTENSNFDIMIEKTGQFGTLHWKGDNHRRGTLEGVSNDIKIKKWSNIVTRGGGGIFPRGIPVGKVLKTESVEGKPLWDITLIFSENLATVQNIYVVKNILLVEQAELEEMIP